MSVVFTGTATDWSDLLDKVVTHLTDGAALGAEAWTLLATDVSIPNERYIYLRGPGLSGTDEIYVSIREFNIAAEDKFNWQIRGHVAYNPLNSWDAQPGASPRGNILLWDSTIPYWLVANGRRFILIAKVSTTYQSLYAGFFLPYATSAEMPYPMVIMTCSSTPNNRWSAGNYTVGGFWDPVEWSSWLRHFDGQWIGMANYKARGDGVRHQFASHNVWPFEADYGFGRNRDNTYGLLPAVLHSNHDGGNVYGELEGVFHITGFSLAAEDTVTIGGNTYLVVQSVYRTGVRDYAAIKLG